MIVTCPQCSTRYLTKDAKNPNRKRQLQCNRCQTIWTVSDQDARVRAESRQSRLVDPDRLAFEDNLRETELETLEALSPKAVKGRQKAKIKSEAGDGSADFDDHAASESKLKDKHKSASDDDSYDEGSKPAYGAHISIRDKVEAEKRARHRRKILWIWAIPAILLIIGAVLGFAFKQEAVKRIPLLATFYKNLGITVTQSGLDITPPIAKTALINGDPVLVVNSEVVNLTGKTRILPLIELTLRNGSDEPLVQWYVELDQKKLGAKGSLKFASEFPNPPVDTVKLTYRFAQ